VALAIGTITLTMVIAGAVLAGLVWFARQILLNWQISRHTKRRTESKV